MKNYFEFNSPSLLKLKDIPTEIKTPYTSTEEYEVLLNKNHSRLEDFQTLLDADQNRAVLIIFQGMDTAGKDGAIKHVMSGVNPKGCFVVNFKTPTETELDHDFLWKANVPLPARGQIGIFNRSYYEEILITRVHPKLLEKEKLPEDDKFDKTFWEFRYHDIVNHEKYLHRQGYEIIKIFIHISKAEQKKRLLERFEDPKKLWKISEADLKERRYWKNYQQAYEECIRKTSSKGSPWYIVPGDDKKSGRLSISQILVDRLSRMDLKYPKLKPSEIKRLKKLQASLSKE